MINQINSTNTAQKPVKTSIFYVNDIHGQLPRMEKLTSGVNTFDYKSKMLGVDSFKLSSGDILIGEDEKRNLAAVKFLDVNNFDATTLGNHEFDISANKLAILLSNVKTKILGLNANIPDKSPLKNTVLRSKIIEKNENKYGLIGLNPIDMNSRIKSPDLLDGITIDDYEETKKELQEEVNKLEKQGVNKIILLSHVGNKYEKALAHDVSGIDVILGGHSHNLIKDVKNGENLFMSPKHEPVVITQAGRDGDCYGVLNLEFNKDGQITQVQNNVMQTDLESKSLVMSVIEDEIIGKSEIVGVVKNNIQNTKNLLIEENPYANFIADAMRTEMNADVALVNSANIRGVLSDGKVNVREISSLSPFKNKMLKVKLTEPELVDGIKFYGSSFESAGKKPGIMQVSGLNYVMDIKGELKELYFIDKQ